MVPLRMRPTGESLCAQLFVHLRSSRCHSECDRLRRELDQKSAVIRQQQDENKSSFDRAVEEVKKQTGQYFERGVISSTHIYGPLAVGITEASSRYQHEVEELRRQVDALMPLRYICFPHISHSIVTFLPPLCSVDCRPSVMILVFRSFTVRYTHHTHTDPSHVDQAPIWFLKVCGVVSIASYECSHSSFHNVL